MMERLNKGRDFERGWVVLGGFALVILGVVFGAGLLIAAGLVIEVAGILWTLGALANAMMGGQGRAGAQISEDGGHT